MIIPCLVADEWQEWKFRYLPVFVGFLHLFHSLVNFLKMTSDEDQKVQDFLVSMIKHRGANYSWQPYFHIPKHVCIL